MLISTPLIARPTAARTINESPLRTRSLFVIAVLFVAGCSSATDSPTANASKKTRTPQVTVTVATTEAIIDDREFTGRTAAVASVEIRPRVSGYLLQTPRAVEHHIDGMVNSNPSLATQTSSDDVEYHDALTAKPLLISDSDSPSKSATLNSPFIVKVQEGDFVTAGAPLYEIDPAPYRLAYLQAAGSFDAADAQLKDYRLDLARQKELLPSNATSQSNYDEAVANVAKTIGNIEDLKAAVDRASSGRLDP